MATTGTGLGLRLVRSLAAALMIKFHQRQNGGVFVTQLELPGAMQKRSHDANADVDQHARFGRVAGSGARSR